MTDDQRRTLRETQDSPNLEGSAAFMETIGQILGTDTTLRWLREGRHLPPQLGTGWVPPDARGYLLGRLLQERVAGKFAALRDENVFASYGLSGLFFYTVSKGELTDSFGEKQARAIADHGDEIKEFFRADTSIGVRLDRLILLGYSMFVTNISAETGAVELVIIDNRLGATDLPDTKPAGIFSLRPPYGVGDLHLAPES